jgi:hypothetical protein
MLAGGEGICGGATTTGGVTGRVSGEVTAHPSKLRLQVSPDSIILDLELSNIILALLN